MKSKVLMSIRGTAVLTLCLVLAACSQNKPGEEISADNIALNNKGVALMGSFDYGAAVDTFTQLVEQQPDWVTARTNLAIALKNRQQINDSADALAMLEAILQDHPQDLNANYNAGVLALYQGQIEPAQKYFEATLAGDSDDAYAHYYLGQCRLRLGQPELALESYLSAIELDPQLRSAYYSAALVLRRIGRADESEQQLKAFQKLENNPTARLAEFKYTRMGPKSLAAVAGEQNEAQLLEITGALFESPAELADLSDQNVAGLSAVDLNQNGSVEIAPVTLDVPWAEDAAINAIAWGDVDNDGQVDAYLCRSGLDQLWLATESAQWRKDSVDLGSVASAECADAALVDADHDGDLDVLLLTKDKGADLINNNRDGTFRSLSHQLGATADIGGEHLLAVDLDADRDMDLVFVRSDANHTVLLNDRLWEYRQSSDFEPLESSDALRFASHDFDADGQVELVSLNSTGTIARWAKVDNDVWVATTLHQLGSPAADADLLVTDIDGDMRADILVLAPGSAQVLSESSDSSWHVKEHLEFEGDQPIPVLRSSNCLSLVATARVDGSNKLLEWAPGAGRAKFVTLTFTGKHDAAETMRSNRSGIGSQLGVRVGTNWLRADTGKNSSLPGYSLQPLPVGIGASSSADFVEIDWSDGVYQTELNIPSGAVSQLSEEQRQLGSCPILFAWNGETFNFVTDILGVGAQGFLVEPGTLLPPRPWEYVPFAPGTISPLEGQLQFKLTEPMEESSYIDAMTLHAYDVPKGYELLIDERMGTGAPEVTGEAYVSNQSLTPISAVDSAGNSVLAQVLEKDNTAMKPGKIDRRFIGILEQDETLTIEFDQTLMATEGQTLMLVADSWVELPYSQTHFAAWQAGRAFGSVSLHARDAQGEWHNVYPDFGIPAGMPRVMTLPLLDLPEGSTALKLSWNREIYWDRVRVAVVEKVADEHRVASILPSLAAVEKSGFSRRVTHAQRRPEYIYDERKPYGDVRYPTGFYTALGEMTELISSKDDALAIIGPGEGVHVSFDQPSAPADDFDRWYVLETRGWAKDKDLYTHTGSSVEPLPRLFPERNDPERERLHQQYNVRFQSGR